MNSELRERVVHTIDSAKQVVFGQDNMLEAIVAALICEGHLLIEGMPGLGKTLSVSVMSKICDLNFKRVQFTPDLLPSDLNISYAVIFYNSLFTFIFYPLFWVLFGPYLTIISRLKND